MKLTPKAATYYNIISSHSILEKEKEIIATKKLNVLFEMIKSNSSRLIDITAAKKVATKKLDALFKLAKSKLSRIKEISNPNPTNALCTDPGGVRAKVVSRYGNTSKTQLVIMSNWVENSPPTREVRNPLYCVIVCLAHELLSSFSTQVISL